MKTTPLPSVEDTVDDFFDNTFKWVDMENGLGQYLLMTDVEKHLKAKITQDRNQAYTSLVEGIEGMRKDTEREPNKSDYLGRGKVEMIADIQGFGMDIAYNVALDNIIENVVKPLYGKK